MAAFDARKNFAISTVATAPSPATSGTSLVLSAGDGSKFPLPPFNATVFPTGTNPSYSNAEIVRVTAVSIDTLTIVRVQENSIARTIIVGDNILAGLTDKTLKDVEGYTNPTGTINAYAARVAPTGWLKCDGSAVSRTTYANLFAVLAASLGTFTVTIATPGVVTLTAHGLSTGDGIYLTTTGALPTGLTANTLYYIVRVDANSFNLATSRANAYAGTKITTSGTQSGTHTAWDCPYGLGDGSTTFTLPDLRGKVAAGMDTTGGVAAGNLSLAQTQGVYGNLGASGGEQGHTIVTAELASHTHSTTNLQNPNTGTTNGTGYFTTGGGNSAWNATTFLTGSNSSGGDTAHNNVQPVQLVNYIIKT